MRGSVVNETSQSRKGFTKAVSRRALFLYFASLFLCVLALNIFSQSLPVAVPQTVGMSAEKLNLIDRIVSGEISAKKVPGAVVIVGHRGKIVYRKAFGNRSLVPNVEKMTVDTIFDAASLTKGVATSTSIMVLLEQGKLRLSDSVGNFFPEIEDAAAKRVTILQMLTHVSGFAPDFDLKEKWTGRKGMVAALKKEKLRSVPGTKFVYSDINFEILGEIVEKVSGRRLEDFSEDIFRSLGMMDSRFFNFEPKAIAENRETFPIDEISPALLARIAPTENIRGQNSYLGSTFEGDAKTGERILRGQVHDPTAYRMGGVAGHAGLFTTADDLARYAQMLLNGGVLGGKRVLSAQTVSRMTAPVVVSETGDTRALGFDINTSFSSNRGDLFPLGSFGHTGFTGTSLWIDRVSQTFVVILSNRVHPDGKGDAGPLRAKIATIVASAVEDTPIEQIRLAESTYQAQVAAQIPKFKDLVEKSKQPPTVVSQRAAETANQAIGTKACTTDKNASEAISSGRTSPTAITATRP